MPFLLINEKGLFARARFTGVITQAGWTHLQNCRPAMSPPDAVVFDEVRPFVDMLKEGSGFFFFGPNDGDASKLAGGPGAPSTHHPHGHGSAPALGWVQPGTFQGNSSAGHFGDPLPSERAEELGWVGVQALAHPKRVEKWRALLEKHGVAEGYECFKGAKNILTRAKDWRFEPENIGAQLRKAASCAIFSPTRTGYLNDKADWGPLAGCRLFESEAAARRTCTSRGLTDFVVVEVVAQVQGLAPGQSATAELGQLRGVLAEIQAEQLAMTVPDSSPTEGGRRPRM